MGIKVYMFDNNTGRDIPEQVDTVMVDLLLGSKVSDIHDAIDKGSRLFCVFTKLADTDIIVPSEYHKKLLSDVLSFGKYEYKIEVKPTSIWYTDRVDTNIIISDSVDLDARGISTMLRLYLDAIKRDKEATGAIPRVEMYIVYNIRSGNTLFKTPNFAEAKKICDKNPCCVLKTRSGDIVYKSGYGKVSVPITNMSKLARIKDTVMPNSDDSARIKIK